MIKTIKILRKKGIIRTTPNNQKSKEKFEFKLLKDWVWKTVLQKDEGNSN